MGKLLTLLGLAGIGTSLSLPLSSSSVPLVCLARFEGIARLFFGAIGARDWT